MSRHIVVIGGGLAGLSASYDLARAGQQVTLLETEAQLGGLASSFLLEGQPVERFYHFICRADRELIDFVGQLGLAGEIHWTQTRTAFFHQGRLYPFGTPFDLLSFSTIPWIQRLRFGLHILRSRYRSQWRWLDQIPAKPWLIECIGEQAYNVIWHPLLRIKFGQYYEEISAAWVWHRIWRVAQSRRFLWQRETFGCLRQGSATLVNYLENWLRNQPNVQVLTNTTVSSIQIQANKIKEVKTATGEVFQCKALLSTIALPSLRRILPEDGWLSFGASQAIEYIGVVCVILNLAQPFSRNFWMNINDGQISFNGIIEYTNLNRNLHREGLNLVYIPFYLPTNEPRYIAADQDLIAEIIPMLQHINPAFHPQWIKESFVFRTPYAQAICTTGFAQRIPAIRTPLPGLYLTDSSQFYPEDRTLSAAIRQGRRAAQAIWEDLHGAG